jgi:acyl-homoserine lactone synthase
MIVIHVVTAANRSLYETCLEQLFALRHQIFVGERGWTDLERPDGREIDAYDNDDTVYLVALEGERIIGGHRLYPTVKPNMMGEVFPHLASVRGVPEDLAVWEWSRYFVVKDRRDGKLNLMLMAAVQELCLAEGITDVSAVMEIWWLPRFQDASFTVRPLGLPALVNGEWTMAALIEVSAQTLDHVKEKAGIHGSVLVRRGPQRPLIDHRIVERRRHIGGRS